MIKKQIPNVLSVIRLCLIPVMVASFCAEMRINAFIVFSVASLTDVVDGFLARKYGWITELGKILDPLADKLLQFTTAVCLALGNPVFWAIAALALVKEFMMLLGGLIVLRRSKVQVVSMWYGKLATVIYFVIVSIFIVFTDIAPFDVILTAVLCAVMLITLLLYYFKAFRGVYGMTIRK